VQIGIGVKTAAVYRIIEQGNVVHTENTLDVAVQGRGMFRIQLPSGEDGYTRAGTFQLSPTGEIVTADGFPVGPGIVIPQDATDISINKTGEVQVKIAGQVDPTNVGQLELVIFPNEAGLEAVGDNLFLETPASGSAIIGVPGQDGVGTVLQGFLETSNINPVHEITTMITAQRAYEMNSRVITLSDEMLQAVNRLR
jgi:flagellar basal-body rod protein FlgG